MAANPAAAGAGDCAAAAEPKRRPSALHVLTGGNADVVVAPLALQRVYHFLSQGARIIGEDDDAAQSSPISCILDLSFHPGHVMVLIGVQLVGQILHDVAEDDGVNVIAQHVQQEPVAHFRSAHDHLDRVAFH